MQPYFFPYLGYFQLINSVDCFVFYDDVNFIKGGWINRNKVLVNGEPKYWGINLSGASPNKLINEIKIKDNTTKLLKTIKQEYSHATFFSEVYNILVETFSSINPSTSISELAISSIKNVTSYLELRTAYSVSSIDFSETKSLSRHERLIEICRQNQCNKYINLAGGKKIYSKDHFRSQGIELNFIEHFLANYRQFNETSIPGLSIIDVLMFNSRQEISKMLEDYELV